MSDAHDLNTALYKITSAATRMGGSDLGTHLLDRENVQNGGPGSALSTLLQTGPESPLLVSTDPFPAAHWILSPQIPWHKLLPVFT